MSKIYEGKLIGTGLKIGVVVSRFNEFITSRLQKGCLDGLLRHGVAKEDIDIAKVPGAYEIAQVARKMAISGKYDAIVCLGAVIQGETPHFEYIAQQAARGISQVGLETGIPATFGVLTCETVEQAIERAGTKSNNKGYEAACAAIEMANLMKEI